MELEEESQRGATIVTVSGRIDSANAKQFEEALMSRLSAVASSVLLDLSRLQYISSAGLRVILLAAKQQQASQRSFALCSLTPMIKEVFEVSGFNRILGIYPSRDEALAAL
ncbi:MAG: STAS domain-containing protein [Alphaproteobacteria bacterium]